jgi:hypothetical protein
MTAKLLIGWEPNLCDSSSMDWTSAQAQSATRAPSWCDCRQRTKLQSREAEISNELLYQT